MRSDVEEIWRAARRGAALTRQLTIFSRHESQSLESLNLNDVVSDLEALLEAHSRRAHRADGEPGREPLADRGRSRPDRAGARQSGAQLARCDAGRGHAQGDHRVGAARRSRGQPLSVDRTWQFRPAHGRGHRRRHGRRGCSASLRALLYDQGSGRGNRSRAGDRLRHRDQRRWRRRTFLRARPRNGDQRATSRPPLQCRVRRSRHRRAPPSFGERDRPRRGGRPEHAADGGADPSPGRL